MKARTWAVVSLASALLVAIVASKGSAQDPGNAGKPAAVVNGETISLAEVDTAVKVLSGPATVPIPDSRRRELRLQALSMLMDELLFQQFLRQNAPRVDPAEATKQINELEVALRKQNKRLSEHLAENGMTEAQLRKHFIAGLQWRDYTKDRVTDEIVQQYYKENKDFFDGVQVRASHILLRVPLRAGDGEVQAAAAKLQAIRQEIEAGKNPFAEAAKKYSQCPSAPEGGDLGYFPRKFFIDEEFAKAVFNPQLRVGDMVGPIRTEMGVHLINLTDRKPGQPSDFNKIKDDVRKLYLHELGTSIIAQQRKLARIDMYLP